MAQYSIMEYLVPHTQKLILLELELDNRLNRWFRYNVVAALLPLIVTWFIYYLIDRLNTETMSSSPELLIFILILSATALGDLNDVNDYAKGTPTLGVIKTILFIGTLAPAILYGSFVFTSLYKTSNIGSELVLFQFNLFPISAVGAILYFLLCLGVQIMIGTITREGDSRSGGDA